jgi:hypothetical protein
VGKGGIGMNMKRIEISLIYKDAREANPEIFGIISNFVNMLSNLPADIQHNIDDIEFKVENLDDGRFDKVDSPEE